MEQQHLPPEQTGEVAPSRNESEVQDLTTREEPAEHPLPEAELGSVLRQDTNRRLASIFLFPAVPFALFFALQHMLGEEAWIRLCTNPVFIVSVMVLIGAYAPLALLGPSRKARHAANRLSGLDDLRAIGAMVETLSFGHDREVKAPVRETLIRLLPRLKASDAGLLTERHIALLRATLATSPYVTGDLFARLSRRVDAHTQLQIAILKAFEQVGDSRSLPVVANLAMSGVRPEVRAAAEECLPFLQARVEQERASQTLLRAASAGGSDPSGLLRASQEGQEHAPREMLRPSAEPEPDAKPTPADQTRLDVSDRLVFSS
jgi:hypothetical protein